MNSRSPSPQAALALALFLLGIGFFVGLGYQSRAAQQSRQNPAATPTPSAKRAPLVKALHSSPDGKRLAFTSVYNQGSSSGVWVFDMPGRRAEFSPSPAGWQDYVAQWSNDGKGLILEREKIPRAAASARAGIYVAPIDSATLKTGQLVPKTPALPKGEKLISSFVAPDGKIMVKTRREPKSLWTGDATPKKLDSATNTYGQNRAVLENGQTVLYVVRDAPESNGALALFRVQNGVAKRLSPFWDDLSWSYIAPSGHSLIIARQIEGAEGQDWEWTLYKIAPTGAQKLKSSIIPGDVISVYWSPDEKHVLGAAGSKLWIVDVPSLAYRRLGDRADWNADDATWIGTQNSVAVAANGKLWRVEVPSGQTSLMWTFPDEFWN